MAAPVQTVAVNRRGVFGDKRYVDATITYDTGNYVSGGVLLGASDFGLISLDGVDVLGSSVHGGEYDHVAGKMVLRVKSTGAEVGNGVALTTANALKVKAYGV